MHLLSKTTPKGSYCISSDGKKRTNKPADCETVPGYPLYCRID